MEPTRPQTALNASPDAVQVVEKFIQNTDWTQFWYRVTERTTAEVEAYEKARAKSLQTAPQHVFM